MFYHICGVCQTASSALQSHQVTALLCEVKKGESRLRFESGRMSIPFLQHLFSCLTNPFRQACQIFFGNICAVHLNAFPIFKNRGRNITSHTVPRLLKNRRYKCQCGTFPVCSCDMDQGKPVLRVSQTAQHLRQRTKRKLFPRIPVAPFQKFPCFSVIHPFFTILHLLIAVYSIVYFCLYFKYYAYDETKFFSMRNPGLGHGNLLDRTALLPCARPETYRDLLSLDVPDLRMRRLSGASDAAAPPLCFLAEGPDLYVSDLSGRIHQRQSVESARHVSLELWTESISDPRSHPSGFCPALVSGRSSVRANDKSFKNKLNFPPVSCILMGRARPLSVRLY